MRKNLMVKLTSLKSICSVLNAAQHLWPTFALGHQFVTFHNYTGGSRDVIVFFSLMFIILWGLVISMFISIVNHWSNKWFFCFVAGRNLFRSPDYSPLCPDTIMNNISLEAQGCSFEIIHLQYILAPELFYYECFQIYGKIKWNVS